MLNQGGSFVTRDNALVTGFALSPDHSQDYGFKFDAGDDFDVAYTLTLTQTRAAAVPQFVSKACVCDNSQWACSTEYSGFQFQWCEM